MAEFTASPSAIRSFGASSAAVGDTIAAAAAMDQAANMAVMVPVFGLIGQEFLASFGVAQFNNATAIAQLVAVHQGTAAASLASASHYEAREAETAAALKRVGQPL